jgi:hypothetical protein
MREGKERNEWFFAHTLKSKQGFSQQQQPHYNTKKKGRKRRGKTTTKR